MSFEIIVDCIMALGALATAATFVLVLINSLSIGTYSSWKQYISENSDKFEG